MNNPTIIATLWALFIAGLAASLHCIGMCGPIVVGFTQVFEKTNLTVSGKKIDDTDESKPGRWRLFLDLGCYHAGRIWTYALLGFVTGLAGQTLRESAAFAGFQTWASLAISLFIVVTGLVMLDLLPFLRLEKVMNGCAFGRFGQARWFTALLHSRGVIARFMLGVIMGFLPCGLVYMMLAATLVLPGPGYAALGMIVFGLGTLPSLTAAVMALKMVPIRYRMHSTRVAAVLVIAMGSWMMYRSAMAGENCHPPVDQQVQTTGATPHSCCPMENPGDMEKEADKTAP